jgi:hypothetical protein
MPRKGLAPGYFDHVRNSEVICETAGDLVRFGNQEIVDNFFRALAAHGTEAIKAAWFLELARSRADVDHPPDRMATNELLSDHGQLRAASSVVRPSLVATEKSPTYWRDTLQALCVGF